MSTKNQPFFYAINSVSFSYYCCFIILILSLVSQHGYAIEKDSDGLTKGTHSKKSIRFFSHFGSEINRNKIDELSKSNYIYHTKFIDTVGNYNREISMIAVDRKQTNESNILSDKDDSLTTDDNNDQWAIIQKVINNDKEGEEAVWKKIKIMLSEAQRTTSRTFSI